MIHIIHTETLRFDEIESLITIYENTLHDIKTPISIIYLNLQNMLTDCVSLSRNDSLFEQISISLKHCESVVELLRSVAEAGLSAHGPVSALSSHDLAALAAAVSDNMRALAARKGVSLTFRSVPDSVYVRGDKQMLERVIINILSNAIKYTPNGSSVAVSVEAARGAGLLTVADTGPGFSADILKNPFKRHTKNNPSFTSQGIGLSIAAEIVHALNGKINARNGTLGGAVVTIELPAATAVPESKAELMTTSPD